MTETGSKDNNCRAEVFEECSNLQKERQNKYWNWLKTERFKPK
jgi:hypothetical protein